MIAGQLSPGRNWPLAPISKPVGVCIQLLTDSIQKAEMKVPIATAQVAAKCRPLPTLLMPNSMTPRKPASRKKAVSRSEEHTSELQSLMRISYAVFCLKKKNIHTTHQSTNDTEIF